MDSLISTESLTQALLPFVVGFATLAATVFAMFAFILNRMRKIIEKQDAEKVEISADREKTVEKLRVREDEMHLMRRELADMKEELKARDTRLDEMSKQMTELIVRANRQDEEIARLRGEQESDRKFYQGKIDAEVAARQRSDVERTKLEGQLAAANIERDAMARRLEDQTKLYTAQMSEMDLRRKQLEQSIPDRVSTATAPLSARVDELTRTNSALETRIQELEKRGVDSDA